MKKKLLGAACVVLALIVAVLVYFEFHYPVTRRVHVNMNAKEILAELPEAAVSENDMALWDALYAEPAVRTAFANLTEPDEFMKVDNKFIQTLQETYCPQAENMRIDLWPGERALMTYYCGEQFIKMIFTADGINTKTVYVDDGKADYVRYDCDGDGNLSKEMTKRIWFGFLKYWNCSGPEYEPNPFA
ncbi:MAG: hypothetical protein HFG45_08005 [Oscillospiraceae bacterium]|nr:hypothetical protein [Oscillospiraceae bacterium]